MLTRLLACLCFLALCSAAGAKGFDDWRDGDLVFQDSGGSQAAAIRLATKSDYTHMGIVRVEPSGPVVIEAARTVGETPLASFLARGEGGRYAVYRLRKAGAADIKAALDGTRRYFGRPYDIFFRLDPSEIYCSELPYHAFKAAGITLGKIERFGALGIDNPAVKKLFMARWQRHPDCGGTDAEGCWRRMQDQVLVTPVSIAADPQLERVYSDFSEGSAR